ncbi:MAG: glycosyltransferase [Nanoarchaeota archaeon]|nr:glycosyltransferase [DPANN group archaeon]MBL7116709.1 glycosyltransferase [Nanoarchaeota archaeon]
MKSQIEVSVIIPTFNRELLLQGCLDSLSSQTFPKHKFEVIVVDDCSNYDVSRLIKHSKIKDISLVSCRHHSGKPGFVRSLGIKKSKGRVIAFIDDDFVANPDWIEKIVYYHKQFKQELIIQGGLDVYYKYHLIGLLWKFILDVNIEKKIARHDGKIYISLLGTGNFSVKKKFFDMFFLMEFPITREDELLRRRLDTQNVKILFIPEIKAFNKRKDSVFSFLKQSYVYGLGDCQLKNILGKHYKNTSVSLISFSTIRKLVKRFGIKSIVLFFLLLMKNFAHFLGTLRLRTSSKTALIIGIRHLETRIKTLFHIGLPLPTNITIGTTSRCNYRCVKCGIWEENNKDFLSREEIKHIILKLKNWLGSFVFTISGGEPMLRKDIYDVISFCTQNGIMTHLLTNGSLLNSKSMQKLESSGLSFLSVSLESVNPEIHDSIVGAKGSCEHLKNVIRLSKDFSFKTFISTVLMKENLESIKSLVEFVDSYSNGIRFQCLTQKPYHDKTYNQYWYKNNPSWPNSNEVDKIFNTIKSMKKSKILNSEKQLRLMKQYFLNNKSVSMRCFVGNQNFLISYRGDVKYCYSFPPIGNILEDNPRKIWSSQQAKKQRKQIYYCKDKCVLLNCNYQDSFLHKIKKFISVTRRFA